MEETPPSECRCTHPQLISIALWPDMQITKKQVEGLIESMYPAAIHFAESPILLCSCLLNLSNHCILTLNGRMSTCGSIANAVTVP